jgi:hypothetical protein
VRRLAATGLLLLLPGCATAPTSSGTLEGGVFVSSKGYRVRVPADGWRREARDQADLTLTRTGAPGGMVVDATCGGAEMTRALPIVLRHLTFGLERRETVATSEEPVAGLPAAHTVLRGTTGRQEVGVEAVVVRGPRCLYDFLYVAPAAEFEIGRPDFKRLVDSLGVTPP